MVLLLIFCESGRRAYVFRQAKGIKLLQQLQQSAKEEAGERVTVDNFLCQFVRPFQDDSEKKIQNENVKENPLCIAMM